MNKNSTLTGRYVLILTIMVALAISAKAYSSIYLTFAILFLISGLTGNNNALYRSSNVLPGVLTFVKIDEVFDDSTLLISMSHHSEIIPVQESKSEAIEYFGALR